MHVGNQEYVAVEEQSVWDNIRLLQQWGPLVSYIHAFLATKDVHQKAVIVAEACEWLASKSKTKLDDQLVSILSTLLRSPEGETLLKWVLEKIDGAKA